jgi:sporadic carbohydrate cluster protein (TIGR04323 family)
VKKKSIGYVTGHHFGGWNIPQKIQTAILNFNSINKKLNLSYIVTEYKDSKKNDILLSKIDKDPDIANIFFTSVLQLNANNVQLFKKIKRFNLYFFLENMIIKKNQDKLNLKNYIIELDKRDLILFNRKGYNSLFEDYKKQFN